MKLNIKYVGIGLLVPAVISLLWFIQFTMTQEELKTVNKTENTTTPSIMIENISTIKNDSIVNDTINFTPVINQTENISIIIEEMLKPKKKKKSGGSSGGSSNNDPVLLWNPVYKYGDENIIEETKDSITIKRINIQKFDFKTYFIGKVKIIEVDGNYTKDDLTWLGARLTIANPNNLMEKFEVRLYPEENRFRDKSLVAVNYVDRNNNIRKVLLVVPLLVM